VYTCITAYNARTSCSGELPVLCLVVRCAGRKNHAVTAAVTHAVAVPCIALPDVKLCTGSLRTVSAVTQRQTAVSRAANNLTHCNRRTQGV